MDINTSMHAEDELPPPFQDTNMDAQSWTKEIHIPSQASHKSLQPKDEDRLCIHVHLEGGLTTYIHRSHSGAQV